MIHASIYGRLGRDPQLRETQSGKTMTLASVAVDATGHDAEEQETIWFSVLAFGRVADELGRHAKGDLVSLSGRVTQSRWTTSAGEERTQLSLIADSVISARTVRPGGRRRNARQEHEPPVEAYDDWS